MFINMNRAEAECSSIPIGHPHMSSIAPTQYDVDFLEGIHAIRVEIIGQSDNLKNHVTKIHHPHVSSIAPTQYDAWNLLFAGMYPCIICGNYGPEVTT